jgi:hypothetical protein
VDTDRSAYSARIPEGVVKKDEPPVINVPNPLNSSKLALYTGKKHIRLQQILADN